VPISAVKKLLAMLGYGNSGADWMAEHKVFMLPKHIVEIAGTVRRLIKDLWATADAVTRDRLSSRTHPPLSYLSIRAQIGERHSVDEKEAQLVHSNNRVTQGLFVHILLFCDNNL
jgi:hypothetical protein